MIRKGIFITALVSLTGCFDNTFEVGDQATTYEVLESITQSPEYCESTNNLKLFAVETSDGGIGYAASINGTPLQLNKTHIVLGGYQVSGVSHDGHYRIAANINLLVKGKTEYFIHKVEHYIDGVIATDLHAICAN